MKTLSEIKDKVQVEALTRWKMAGSRGLLAMATGAGKSKVALNRLKELYAIHGNNLRVLLAVPTIPLRDANWPTEAHDWGMDLEYKQVEGVCYASMPKKPSGHYHFVILDEAHHSTEYNTEIFGDITYDELMMLTATVPDDPIKLKILGDLGPIVFTYDVNQAVDDGLVSEYDLVVVWIAPDTVNKTIPAGNKKKRFMNTEKAAYDYLTRLILPLAIKLRTATKNLKFLELRATTQQELDQLSDLTKEIRSTEGRYQGLIRKRTRFIYEMKSKEQVAKRVLARILKPGKRTLIFAGSIAQADRLCGSQVYHSQVKDKGQALRDFKDLKIDTLCAVNALNEGENIQELDQSLIIQLNSKERDLTQRIGRNIRLRPGHRGKIIVLVAKNTVDEDWYNSASKHIDPKRIIHLNSKDI